MALVDEIAVKLGIENAKFKQALRDTDASVQKFKKGGEFGENEGFGKSIQGMTRAVGQFRALITGGGILMMLRKLFVEGAEYADKHRDSVDQNVQAFIRLQNAAKAAGDKVGESVAKSGGFLENAAIAIAHWANGAKGVITLMQFLKKATVDALAIEEQKAANDLAKVRRDIAYQEADANGKIGMLVQEQIQRQLELGKLKAGTVEHTKKVMEIEKASAEIRKEIAADDKVLLAEEKKQREDLKKIHEDSVRYAERSVALDKELAKLAFERLTPEQQLASLRKDEAKLKAQIRDTSLDENLAKQKKIDLSNVQKQIADTILVVEKQLTPEAKAQAAAKAAALEAEQKALEIMKEKLVQQVQLNAATLKYVNRGFDSELSDRDLALKIARLKAEQAELQVRRSQGDSVWVNPVPLQLAEQEQQLRAMVRGVADRGGIDKALSQFTDLEEDRVRTIIEGVDIHKRNARSLETIAEHLKQAFPI